MSPVCCRSFPPYRHHRGPSLVHPLSHTNLSLPPPANPIYLNSYLLSRLWSLDPFVCSAYIWNWVSRLFLDRTITLCPLNSFFRAILAALYLAFSSYDLSSYFCTLVLTRSSILHFVSYAAACVVLLLSIPHFVYFCLSYYPIFSTYFSLPYDNVWISTMT